ncbi:MAG: adenosylcobinamide-GDP ribazoletransferase [Promethearchaeota archaeon]
MIFKKLLKKIYKEINIFFISLMYFTRIPCPKWIKFSQEYLNQSSRYFSFIGWIVGGISALIFFFCNLVLPFSIAILLSMIGSILITGAFHEDGFADFCDGFGGGYTKEKVLTIMKDSQIGVFGAIGIGLMLTLKFFCLSSITPTLLPWIIIAGHSTSRFASTTFIFTLEYVREDETSKAKPLAKKMSVKSLFVSAVFGIVPIFFIMNYYYFLLIVPVFIARWIIGRKFVKKIGGYTGDCLGAAQQVTEVIFYLFAVMEPWKFI